MESTIYLLPFQNVGNVAYIWKYNVIYVKEVPSNVLKGIHHACLHVYKACISAYVPHDAKISIIMY